MKLLQKTNDKIRDNHTKAKNFYLKALNTLKPLNNDIEIKIELFNEIDETIKSSIDSAFQTIFNRTLKEHELHWKKPQWVGLVFLYDELVSFCYIIESKILFDRKIIKVGGLGGVATLPSHRGLGIASKLLAKVDKFIFEDLKVEYGLLVCEDSLTGFYRQKDWYEIDCPVYYSKKNEYKIFKGNTMLKSNNRKYWPTEINIMGKLW
ncbi:MAG: GNAT family N-acetyltransferase [Balneolaceae bacterium]|jgi:predicted acetyltransferase